MADLKAKAEYATPGPWEALSCAICLPEHDNEQKILGGFYDYDDEPNERFGFGYHNAEFVAAANPSIILALLAWIENLEKELDAARYSEANESGRVVRLEREANWLAKYCEGEEQCPYLSLQWGETNTAPEWCNALDTIEDGFECYEDPVGCWRKVARKAVDDADAALEAEQEAQER